jgi:hypothetical protein
MIKILAAIGGAAVLAGSIVLLSGMTPIDPTVSAQAYGKIASSPVSAKGDRLDIRSYGPGCTERGWPYYEATCLRTSENTEVKRVRVVTTDKLSGDIRFATSQ